MTFTIHAQSERVPLSTLSKDRPGPLGTLAPGQAGVGNPARHGCETGLPPSLALSPALMIARGTHYASRQKPEPRIWKNSTQESRVKKIFLEVILTPLPK